MRVDRIKLVTELLQRDMTQKRLAEKAGVSRCTVTAICNGKTCAASTAVKLAAALGVDVEEIIVKEE